MNREKPVVPGRWLFVNDGARIVPIPAQHIICVRSRANYCDVITSDSVFLVRRSLTRVLAKLDASQFERVSRSHAVNLDAVESFHWQPDRRFEVVLVGGGTVRVTRAASRRIRARAR